MPDPAEASDALWLVVRFKNDRVLARCDASGELITSKGGLVEFRYKPHGKTYRTRRERLAPIEGATPSADAAAPERPRAPEAATSRAGARSVKAKIRKLGQERSATEAIQLWTDGACTGNPGPAGLGVVYMHKDERHELSEYLGRATNNIAELTAILRALEMVGDPARPVDLLSDSDYSLKVVSGIYKAKKNVALIERIRAEMVRFTDLRLVKVPGHAGVPGNELADALARKAISARATARS